MRRTELAYFDGQRVRGFDTDDLAYAALLVGNLDTRTLHGIKVAGLQPNSRINPPAVLRAVDAELGRRGRSEEAFERAKQAGAGARLRRQNWGYLP